MTTVSLVLVIVALLAERAYANRRFEMERTRILNAIMARTPHEFVQMQRVTEDPPKPKVRPEDDGQFVQIGAS